jgi:uncharacterized membrane protein (DUF2068 family)
MEVIEQAGLGRKKGSLGLRLIAAIKVGKAILLTGLALGIFRLINRDLGEFARKIAYHLRIDPENHILRLILAWLTKVDPGDLRKVGMISMLYAGVLYTEGVGLWLGQSWAKYVVLISTGLFVPEEAYGCLRYFRWWRLALLGVNLAVLAFVIYILWIEHRRNERAAR